MKDFNEIVNNGQLFEDSAIKGLSKTEILEATRIYEELNELVGDGGIDALNALNEGILGKIVGGAAGLIIGPSIGKVIANALGIKSGIMYDMFTSRLVGTALGSAIAGGSKKSKK